MADKYPSVITSQMLPKWNHISDSDIRNDIAETEMEIRIREKLNYDPIGIRERQDFVAFLRRLQDARRQQEFSNAVIEGIARTGEV